MVQMPHTRFPTTPDLENTQHKLPSGLLCHGSRVATFKSTTIVRISDLLSCKHLFKLKSAISSLDAPIKTVLTCPSLAILVPKGPIAAPLLMLFASWRHDFGTQSRALARAISGQ